MLEYLDMQYAVITSGGKQYRVSPGTIIEVDRIDQKDGVIEFGEVLLHVNDEDVKIGTPHISGISVTGKIVEHYKGEKVRVARYKAKSRYRQVYGHRSALTRVLIEKIQNGVKSTKSATK